MKITDIQIVPFRWKVDRYRNATPLPRTGVVQTVLKIVTLLAPGVNYDAVPSYLREAPDPIDADGYVTIPTKPGLGYDIVWEYIEEHRVQGG